MVAENNIEQDKTDATIEEHLALIRGALLQLITEHGITAKQLSGCLPMIMLETIRAAAPAIDKEEILLLQFVWTMTIESIEIFWAEGLTCDSSDIPSA